MQKTEEDRGMILLHYGKAVLFGGAAAFLSCLVFLLLSSVAISQGLLDAELCDRFAVAGCVVGSFVGGLFAVRICGAKGLLIGILVGGILFLLQLTLGLLFYDDILPENGGLSLLLASLCGGTAAGLLSRGGKKTTVKKRNRRRGS